MKTEQLYVATVYDSRAENELGTVVAKSYAEAWNIAKGMTPHPVLEWIENGPTGRELT